MANYHQKLKQGYDANVKLRPLAPGDLVANIRDADAKKFIWRNICYMIWGPSNPHFRQ